VIDDLDIRPVPQVFSQILRLLVPDEFVLGVDRKRQTSEQQRAEHVHRVVVDDEPDPSAAPG